jgi:3alpha(or 20beta)-hydroxysteroid dehydrogenase
VTGRLEGKTAIVTGAARGSGAEIAKVFAAEGASVIVADVLDDLGAATAESLGSGARFVHCDVTSEADWSNVMASVDTLTILVNNAAVLVLRSIANTTVADYRRIFEVNELGTFLGIRAAIEPMRAAGGGSIVNISSVAGLKGSNKLFAYGATKWAVRGMTQSAALELARHKIRVNCIFQGVIDTPINDPNPPGMNENLVRITPMRRMGEPVEIANAVLYLVSPGSTFTTGAELAVDGGMSI